MGAADPAQETVGAAQETAVPDASDAGTPDAFLVTAAEDAGSAEPADQGAAPDGYEAEGPEAHQPSAAQNGAGPDSTGQDPAAQADQNPTTQDGAALLGQEAEQSAG